ncbi:MAG TPA: hypothetical protein VML96_03800 [Egibacteraceae bacterium]|nr:hypothetical protein [Egibacteraceae bacterium]
MADRSMEATGATVDQVAERLGRWAAGRTTRRSFLGRLGRLAVLVAGGSTMATLLAESASARVCGQSGVSPKCDTFDCDATWGWCWYASGCCAGGLLKKICDCCAPNTPNPVGYCPSGTRVLCILESCGADPRLQTREIVRTDSDDPIDIAVRISQHRFPGRSPIAVLGDAESAFHAAVAASLGRVSGGPVLLTGRGALSGPVAEELRRLRVEFVKVAGSQLSEHIDEQLAQMRISVERVGESADAGDFSAEVAEWSRAMTGARTAIVVLPGTAGAGALASAAACANAAARPLLIGGGERVMQALSTPRRVTRTWVLGDSESDAAAFFGGRPLIEGNAAALARLLADTARAMGAPREAVGLAPLKSGMVAAAMAALPAPLLYHAPGSMDGAFDWLLRNRDGLTAAYQGGGPDAFDTQAYYELQSVINEYEVHLLRGVAGQGLPVIPQPHSERPIGRARR